MSHFAGVRQAYQDAWSRRWVFAAIRVALQMAAGAIIAPALAGLVALAVSTSDQSALTDQDIALFLLTPGGFVAAVGVAAVWLVASVWGFAMMAAVLRAGPLAPWPGLVHALFAVARRAGPLLAFAVMFVLRVLALVVPIAVAGLLVADRYMGEFDINYYLTFRPPEFLTGVAIIGALLLVMVVIGLRILTGWALALHLVVFGNVSPRAAFGESATRMQGRRAALATKLVLWLVVLTVLSGILGLIASLVFNLVPLNSGSGLKLALGLTLGVVALWSLAILVLGAVGLGALARLLDGFYQDATPLEPLPKGVGTSLKRKVAVTGAGLIVLAVGAGWATNRLLDRLQTEDRVEIIAHRGAAGMRPENTMAAFEKAIEDGADWIELDVQETRDGAVIIMHDSDFMKLAGVDLKVWDADLADVEEIDIGSWFAPEYADQRAPLLRDVLTLAKGRIKVLIELKYYGKDQMLADRVAQIVDDLGMADQVAVMSLKYLAVQEMQALRPDWRTGVLAATAVGKLAGLAGDFIAVSTSSAGPRLARSIQAAGKDLYVWTVDDPLDMSRMISMGANGLITNEPALAAKVLEVRAGLNTAERLILWLSERLGLELNTKEYRDDQP
jgi:glycerophosphoryl diester phosphodiesterase